MRKYSCAVGLKFEALGVLGSKSYRKQTPIFFKKMGVCFLQPFDPSTPKAYNCNPTAHDYFLHMKVYFWENYRILITLAICPFLEF